MDLRKLTHALGKRWYLVLLGILLGVCLVFLGMYQVRFVRPGASASLRSRVALKRRSFKTYKTLLAVVIDEPSAALGRTDVEIPPLVSLAPTYAYMATDDTVMRTLEAKYGRPLKAEVSAVAIEGSPIVQLTVQGKDPAYITKVAATAQEAFFAELEAYQKANQIPEDLRIVVRPLGPPSRPELVISREYEIWTILFLMPVVALVSLALLLENWSRSDAIASSQPVAALNSDAPASASDAAAPADVPGDAEAAGTDGARHQRLGWPWT